MVGEVFHGSEECSMVPSNVSCFLEMFHCDEEFLLDSEQCFMIPNSDSWFRKVFHGSEECSMILRSVNSDSDSGFRMEGAFPLQRLFFQNLSFQNCFFPQ